MSLINSSITADDQSTGRRYQCKQEPSQLIHFPTRGTSSTTCPASPKASVGEEESFLSLAEKEGPVGIGGSPSLPQHAQPWGTSVPWKAQRERDAPRPTAPTALPPADSKQSTFTLKQPTSHNLICHFLHQKWSSFLWHPDNVNEMENTPSGSYHAEQNLERDISRGRLSTFLWADETSLIMLDTLCLTSPQLTKFWLQRCCLYCHHNTECKNEMKYILTGL